MSTESHHNSPSHEEHGTVASYVIGFILSLIFTIIPYYLVVNKVIAGNALALTILGIAVIQMAIQMLFFLHLGRGPKPLYNVVFFFATGGIIVLTVGASLFIMDNLYRNMSPQEVTTRIAQEENIAQISGQDTGACKVVKENHLVTISEGKPSPLRIEAKRCDSLTFINEDEQKREIIFGSQSDPWSYGGLYEVGVSKGHPETITLNETGEFTYSDNLDPYVAGYFTVLD